MVAPTQVYPESLGNSRFGSGVHTLSFRSPKPYPRFGGGSFLRVRRATLFLPQVCVSAHGCTVIGAGLEALLALVFDVALAFNAARPSHAALLL